MDAEAVLKKARGAHEDGQYQEADGLYSDVISAWDTDHLDELSGDDHRRLSLARVYNDRGHCRYKLVCFDEAILDLIRAVELDPKLAPAYYTRGTIHYRLCYAQPLENGQRLATLGKALDDLHEAVDLKPDNPEFQLGLQKCKEEVIKIIDCVKMKVLELNGVGLGKLTRLMFLLDSGDPSMGSSDSQHRRNTTGALQGRHALLSSLTIHDRSCRWLAALLELRAQQLLNRVFVELPEDTEAADRAVRWQGEELLVFVEACHHLHIIFHHLQSKVVIVQKMMKLTETERKGSFFLYAENLLVSRMCDNLTPSLVHKLYLVMKNNNDFREFIDEGFHVSEVQVNEEEGLKEVLFFYLIRVLEFNKLLNRIYTDNLKNILQDLKKSCIDEEKQVLSKVIITLQNYPNECQPPGLCVIFCVTDDRPGADYEIAKIESVFHDRLGFTVLTERNPNKETLDRYAKKLQKPKYNFYDSFIFWFVSHGSETEIMLADKEPYRRDDFIYNFSLPDNFRKKPKIFFMATCQGCKAIQVRDVGGVYVAADGVPNLQLEDVPLIYQDIGSVYYQMDRIIASAALPEKLAFRLDDKGSIFVDTVCCLLEERRGENLTVVLEEACRRIHRILFTSADNKFKGSAKQACYYQSTLQKTFLIPHPS